MRRQDLITALLRNPDTPVLVDGNPVVAAVVSAAGIVLKTSAIDTVAASLADDALETASKAHAQDLERVRADDRAAAEEELAKLREAFAAEKADAVANAVAETIAAERAAQAKVVEAKEWAVQDGEAGKA